MGTAEGRDLDELRLVGLIAALAVVRLVAAGSLDLIADEAYHWTWSGSLALGYYDQPPLVAWGIAAGRLLADHQSWAIRLPGLLWSLGGAGALIATARGDRELLARIVVGAPPLAFLGSLAVPDAYLLGSWMFGLAAALRGQWIAVGVFGALATLSKHDGLALFPLVWLASADRWSRGAALGAAVHCALLAPHVGWLATHDWVTVRFQLHEGLLAASAPGWQGPLKVGGEQLALVPAGLALPFALRRSDPEARIALATSLPLFVGFAVAAALAPSEAHWPAPGWIGAALLLARAEGPAGKLADVGSWLGVFATLTLGVHAFSPLAKLPSDPATRFTEGAALGDHVAREALPEGVAPWEPGATEVGVVFTERYQEAALVAWSTGIPARVHPGCGRRNQADLLPPPELPARLLFVRPSRSGPAPTCTAPRSGTLRRVEERDPEGRRIPAFDLGWLQ